MKTYLCGPINGCTDDECRNWREAAKANLTDTLDPMRRDYRGREDQCVAEIVEGDIADINECEALLVNYDKPSVGTAMEVFLAFRAGKVVVVVAKPNTSISPWLRYHSTHIVNSFERAFELLKHPAHIAHDDKKPDHN